MIIVDTNVWSVLFSRRPEPRVVDWISEHDSELWLSTIAIAEMRYGAELPQAAAIRSRILGWLAGLEAAYAVRVLPFDVDAANLFGALRARRPEESKLLDIAIAAQGLSHGATIATRNVRDFAWTGVKLIDPWTARPPASPNNRTRTPAR